MAMDGVTRVSLHVQSVLGRLGVLCIAPPAYAAIKILRYRFAELKETRRFCRGLFAQHRGPWLICANHLTMIDSVLLIYAMLSLWECVILYRRVPWNLPERDNFSRNLAMRLVCYLSKCLPVRRGGERQELQRVLDKCHALLSAGNGIMVFPEGGRSRSGRIDTERLAYGVGRFVQRHPDMKILCLYLRGEGQDRYSALPRVGEVFHLEAAVFDPCRSAEGGLRAQREYATQIIRQLAAMEERHFARWQRHYRPGRSIQPSENRGSTIS